jgi:uroporphyrinogen-III synthase
VSEGPLDGCGVLITRPEHQSHELATAIEAAGGDVYRFPVMDIEGRDAAEIRQDFAGLAKPDIVIFVSGNAVAHGFAVAGHAGAKIAAVGPATRAAIGRLGEGVDIFPESGFDSEHLLEHEALQDVRGKNVVIVRGQSGRELLADTLRSRGAQVAYLCVYNRRAHEPTPAEMEELESILRRGCVQFVTVMSAETAQHLAEILTEQSMQLLRKSALVAPGSRVLQTASALIPGIPAVAASGPQAQAMVDTLIDQWQTGWNS